MDKRPQAENNGFAIASVVFGAFALLTGFVVVLLPLNFALSITFALLSRGNRRLPSLSVLGIILSCIGLAIAVLAVALFGFFLFDSVSMGFRTYEFMLRELIGAVGKAGGFYA